VISISGTRKEGIVALNKTPQIKHVRKGNWYTNPQKERKVMREVVKLFDDIEKEEN
jgi:hypothetical protein